MGKGRGPGWVPRPSKLYRKCAVTGHAYLSGTCRRMIVSPSSPMSVSRLRSSSANASTTFQCSSMTRIASSSQAWRYAASCSSEPHTNRLDFPMPDVRDNPTLFLLKGPCTSARPGRVVRERPADPRH
jgi:hypothetical protein